MYCHMERTCPPARRRLCQQHGRHFANDRENISLMTTPVLILCIIMMVLTLVGLVGTQMQLMNQYKQVAFSLVMGGMEWRTWKTAG